MEEKDHRVIISKKKNAASLSFASDRLQCCNTDRTDDFQYHKQESISFKALLPGDLVFFFWNDGEPEHVGIYIGNGKYIDAQNTVGAGPGATGEVTVSSFDNWNKKYFVGGRRFH